MYPPPSDSALQEIQLFAKQTKIKLEYRRAQCVFLFFSSQKSTEEIAKSLNIHTRTVYKYCAAFLKLGIQAFVSKHTRSGRKPLFSASEFSTVLKDILPQAEQGQLLTATQVQKALQASTQKKTSLPTVLSALKRHGWTKKKPRPRHPQGDLQEQALFKKNA